MMKISMDRISDEEMKVMDINNLPENVNKIAVFLCLLNMNKKDVALDFAERNKLNKVDYLIGSPWQYKHKEQLSVSIFNPLFLIFDGRCDLDKFNRFMNFFDIKLLTFNPQKERMSEMCNALRKETQREIEFTMHEFASLGSLYNRAESYIYEKGIRYYANKIPDEQVMKNVYDISNKILNEYKYKPNESDISEIIMSYECLNNKDAAKYIKYITEDNLFLQEKSLHEMYFIEAKKEHGNDDIIKEFIGKDFDYNKIPSSYKEETYLSFLSKKIPNNPNICDQILLLMNNYKFDLDKEGVLLGNIINYYINENDIKQRNKMEKIVSNIMNHGIDLREEFKIEYNENISLLEYMEKRKNGTFKARECQRANKMDKLFSSLKSNAESGLALKEKNDIEKHLDNNQFNVLKTSTRKRM